LQYFLYTSIFLFFLLHCRAKEDIAASKMANNDLEESAVTQEIISLTYLALGDSYTIGESVVEAERWPNQLKEVLSKVQIVIDSVTIIAKTGWRTDNLKMAMAANQKFDYGMVSLLIGVNNQYQGRSPESYEPEFEELLNLAIARADGNNRKVFVLSIPDYGFTPFGAENQSTITTKLKEYNEINKRLTLEKNVWYFDITPISQEGLENTNLVAEDHLHPSGFQYSLWVEEIMKSKAFLDSLRIP
jgi:acyl-CoA thioesterase I